jgi:hypothetical protein
MKRFAAFCILFLAMLGLLQASLDSPITYYVSIADTIYLVRVESVSPASAANGGGYKGFRSAKFVVEETLKGSSVSSVTLAPGIIDVKEGSEFLIVSDEASRKSSGPWSNVVGSEFKGNVGWHDAPIVRDSGEVYVDVWPKGDKIINGRPYLTLDHVKELLKQDADKSPTK